MIRTIQEAEQALLPYVPLVSRLTGKDATLQRITPLMALAGNPQQRLRVVHIAGTSGKTSTAYYIAALLRASGKNVGLTVSPHVDSITERTQINGQPLPEAVFCKELDAFLDIVGRAPQAPSWFELLYSFAIWVFERQHVDYAVVETGMGGLYDATNVANRPDKICVITDIGYDHMHTLGTTLPDIAAQKIGIAHAGNPVLMYMQDEEIMRVIRQRVDKVEAQLLTTTEMAERMACKLDVSSLALYQQRNWLLAHYVYSYIKKRDHLRHPARHTVEETLHIQVPGRMDIRYVRGKTIIMDGAHNEQKMATFIASFREKYPDVKPAIMLAFREGKEYRKIVPLLVSLASQVFLTTFHTSQDLPVRSAPPEVLAALFQQYPNLQVTAIADQSNAYKTLLAASQNVCIITGSFYLLSQLRSQEHELL